MALEDSDLLANADAEPGGDIIINSSVFLADLFSSDRAIPVGRHPGDLERFRRNGEVDISVDFAQYSSQSRQIIEAQGWVKLTNGQIMLVVESPTVTPQGNWQNTTDCNSPE